ncbi:uncharacterized protein LOC141834846 [Curcuma longa]|uniref:uncharacterized protein LOC141834846 n=1 Tax=Curcuma longa TaxID=136217 RepID=UPI003D9E4580
MVSLKRSRGQEEVEGAELLLLLSLSCGTKAPASKAKEKAKAAEEGEFKCKTCSRRFATFQALGGHRTSHKRPRVERPAAGKESGGSHRCGVCGVEFALGQALGGHMRRHKVPPAVDVGEQPVIGEFGRGDEVKKSNVCCIEFDMLVGRSSSQCQLLPLFV